MRPTTVLAFIFFFSGFSSLIYQVVWQRLLTVYYGVGAISITLILSVYMIGLGLGALFGGYLVERVRNRMMLYCVIELLIGAFGLISLPLLDFIGSYTAGSQYQFALCYMFLFLCLPTFFMGATLPILTKIFSRLIDNFLENISFLYFINTLGAAIGTVFTSYFIISFFGLAAAALTAVVINFTLAVLIFFTQNFKSAQPTVQKSAEAVVDQHTIFHRAAYPLVIITGFLAIGYEIVWFRIIGVLVKASPYAFSSVLSVYLLGIAIGSYSIARYLRRHQHQDKKSLFYLLQFLIGLSVMASVLGYYYLTRYTSFEALTIASFTSLLHPSFEIPAIDSFSELLKYIYSMLDVFWWALVFVFVPTILMGASFPLIAHLALSRRDEEGRTVGTIYFFNIGGNVIGGALTGFVLVPILGTGVTLLFFYSVGLIFGLFVGHLGGRRVPLVPKLVVVTGLLATAVVLFPGAGQLYKAMHIRPAPWSQQAEVFFEEGVEGVVLTYQTKDKDKVVNYINGLVHGGRPGYKFYYETLEALSFTPKLDHALIIGFGTGSITEMVSKAGDLQKMTLVELNETLLDNLQKMRVFTTILDDSRLDVVIDDGRRYLLRTNDSFDLIAIDPLRTTTSYSNNLYSRQFFELASQHLSDEGMFLIWTDEHKVMPNTVNAVFEYVRYYRYFILASNSPFSRHSARRAEVLAQFSPIDQQRILAEGDDQYVGDQNYLSQKVGHYPINQDWDPVTEYYLGLKIKRKLYLDR